VVVMRPPLWQILSSVIPAQSVVATMMNMAYPANMSAQTVVMGNDIVPVPEEFREQTQIEMLSKEDLLRQSDFVSLNCDLNPTSYHLMNARLFARMKPSVSETQNSTMFVSGSGATSKPSRESPSASVRAFAWSVARRST